LSELVAILRQLKTNPEDILIRIVKDTLRDRARLKQLVQVLVVACRKDPGFKEDLKKLVDVVSEVIERA
jgi:hypothetical protein